MFKVTLDDPVQFAPLLELDDGEEERKWQRQKRQK